MNQDILAPFDAKIPLSRFAARRIRLHNVDLLFVTMYLRRSEDSSERSNLILHRMNFSEKFTKPNSLYCPAGFSISYYQFLESRWLEMMSVQLVHPKVVSTLSAHDNRIIDLGSIISDAQLIIQEVQPIHSVSWGLHLAVLGTLCMKPRSVSKLVECGLKALPMFIFRNIQDFLCIQRQAQAFYQSVRSAEQMLQKQKCRIRLDILVKSPK